MATYPTSPRSDFLTWCQVHDPVFNDHAAEIGLSAEEATAFRTATTTAQSHMLAQEAAREASKVATQRAHLAFETLARSAGSAVRTIRAFAETSADPDAVYALAEIPAPAQPSPQPPPAQPTRLSIRLEPTAGTIVLRWKVKNPTGTSGTSYIIRRRLPHQAEFAFIGVSGKKVFVDDSLIAGSDSVQYTVQGQRADLAGPVSPVFTVNFGRSADGGRTATVSTNDATQAARGVEPSRWNIDIPTSTGNGRVMAAGQ